MTSSVATTSRLLRLVMLLFCRLVVLSSFLFIICQLKVSQGDVSIMFGLCQVYPSHVRVCRGPSGSARVHPGMSNSSVRVCKGPSGFFRVCQCPLWSVRVHLGQVRVMQGSCQNCVAFLVVFEAETGFSVLLTLGPVGILKVIMLRKDFQTHYCTA